ncbi:MAG: tetratricopeptide repeat protein [Candidatus Thorarchaeota archaeon]
MPSGLESRLEMIVKALETGRVESAVEDLESLVKEYPECVEGWYNLGYAYSLLDRLDESLRAYNEALAIDNMIFEIWFNKGNVLYDMRDFKGALDCYLRAVEIRPDDAEAWNNLGNCYSRLADGKEAIKAYSRAVALKPDYAEALYNNANAHFIEGDHERAVAYAELALSLNPTLKPRVDEWIHLSRAQLESKRWEDSPDSRKESGPRRYKGIRDLTQADRT